jgi:hypothetical protein
MGASAAVNLSYIGNGPSASNQVLSDGTPGPKSKTLYGYGTIVSGSDATTVQINFIDGTSVLKSVPAFVNVFRAGNSGDSAAAGVLSTLQLVPSAVDNAKFVINYPTVTTSGVTLSFGVVIGFSS